MSKSLEPEAPAQRRPSYQVIMRVALSGIALLALGTAAAPAQQQQPLTQVITNVVTKLTGFPRPPPPPVIDLSKYTIGQILNWTLHHPENKQGDDGHRLSFPIPGRSEHRHTLPLHKLAWVVNKTEAIQKILYDEKANLTLFAPGDRGLPDHRHRRGGHEHHGHGPDHHGDDDHSSEDLTASRAVFETLFAESEMLDAAADKDDKDREERRRKLLKLADIILRYHIAPDGAYTGRELADVSTVQTLLPYSRAEGAERFRIRSRPTLLPRPSLVLNFYARARLEVKAKNGIIHLISAPLLPPLSHLSEAFLFPQLFSTLTSAVQKAELDEVLAPWLHHGGKTDEEVDSAINEVLTELINEHVAKEGKREFTVFAPTNLAFYKLGFKINAFLFSPFGRNILKEVLAYHVVPDVSFFTDWQHGVPSPGPKDVEEDVEVEVVEEDEADLMSLLEPPHMPHPPRMPHPPHPPHPPHRRPADVYHFTLPTLLGNQTIGADVVTYRLAFGKGPLARRLRLRPAVGPPKWSLIPDLPVWGGAIHVVTDLLRPSLGHHEHGHHVDEL